MCKKKCSSQEMKTFLMSLARGCVENQGKITRPYQNNNFKAYIEFHCKQSTHSIYVDRNKIEFNG